MIFGTTESERDVVQCLSQYARAALEPEDIARLVHEGLPTCFAFGDSERLREQTRDLRPNLSFGIDARNGKEVELSAFPLPSLFYANVAREECCAVGGELGYATGCFGIHYSACEPPELLQSVKHALYPGGFAVPVKISSCRPGELLLPTGLAIVDPDRVCKSLTRRNEDGLRVECSRRPPLR